MNKDKKTKYFVQRKKDNNWSGLFPVKPKEYELKISVAIPTYNQIKFLKKMLRALDKQTYPKDLFEVIICDDGSSDGTESYVSEVKNNFDFKIDYIWQEDLGHRYTKTANNGIRLASGDVILNLDCDTMPTADCIEKHAIWHHSYKNIVIFGMVIKHAMLFGKIPLFKRSDFKHRIEACKKTDYLKFCSNPWSYSPSAHFSFKRYHAYKAGLYSEEFTGWGSADDEFVWRLYNCGLFIIPDVNITSRHQCHPEDKTKKGRMKNVELFNKIMSSFSFAKISICILLDNQKGQIEEKIDVLGNQKLSSKFEIIIIENNLSDNTIKKIRKYEGVNQKSIKLYRYFKNINIDKFIRLSLEISNGEHIVFIDNIDLFDKDIIQNLLSNLDENSNISSTNFLQPKAQLTYQKLKKEDLGAMLSSSHCLAIRRNRLIEQYEK